MTLTADDLRKPARPRRAWVVFLLSLVIPGLGQLHAGHGWRGVAWWVGGRGVAVLATGIAFPWALAALGAFLLIYVLGAVDAVRVLRRDQAQGAERALPRVATYVAFFVCTLLAHAILGGVASKWASLETFSIASGSSLPNLQVGDIFMAERGRYAAADLRRGEIIVYTRESDLDVFVHRLVGLPGDIIGFTEDGHLLLNGGPVTAVPAHDDQGGTYRAGIGLDLARFSETLPAGGGDGGGDGTDATYVILRDLDHVRPVPATIFVPEGQVFVLGDNRERSADSREAGPVPIDRIIGKARVVLWPGRDPMGMRDWSRIGENLTPF